MGLRTVGVIKRWFSTVSQPMAQLTAHPEIRRKKTRPKKRRHNPRKARTSAHPKNLLESDSKNGH
jgi:hypothetical protein